MGESEIGLRPVGAIRVYAPEGMGNETKRSWEVEKLKAQS